MDRSSLYDIRDAYTYMFDTYSQERVHVDHVVCSFLAMYTYCLIVSFACNLDYHCISAEWVTDMGLLKYSDVCCIDILGLVQES